MGGDDRTADPSVSPRSKKMAAALSGPGYLPIALPDEFENIARRVPKTWTTEIQIYVRAATASPAENEREKQNQYGQIHVGLNCESSASTPGSCEKFLLR